MHADVVVTALAALAQTSRLAVFRLLVQAGPAGLAAGQIAERLGLAAATLSFHLKSLRHAGLITQRRDGRSLIYVADFDRMNALLAYLTENCCGGGTAGCLPTADACSPDGAKCDPGKCDPGLRTRAAS